MYDHVPGHYFVMKTRFVPEIWTKGMIIPIYKSGDPKFTINYRGITLLSCMGKLFTTILNNILYHFVNTSKLLSENQAGFRSGYSTIGHILPTYFIKQTVITLYKSAPNDFNIDMMMYTNHRQTMQTASRLEAVAGPPNSPP